MSAQLSRADFQSESSSEVGKSLSFEQHLASGFYRTAVLIVKEQRTGRSTSKASHYFSFFLTSLYSAYCLLVYISVFPHKGLFASIRGLVLWLRLDYFVWRLLQESVYAVWGYTAVQSIVLVWVFVRCVLGRQVSLRRCRFLLPMFTWRLTIALDVPITALLLANGLARLVVDGDTLLYPRRCGLPPWTAALSLVCFALYCLLQFARELTLTESAHSAATRTIYARATTTAEVMRIAAMHIVAISYFLLSAESAILHLGLMIICCGLVVCVYIHSLPYYNSSGNETMVGCFVFIGVRAVTEIVAICVESDQFAAWGLLFVCPAASGLAVSHLRRWYSATSALYALRLHSQVLPVSQVEVALRPRLCGLTKSAGVSEKAAVVDTLTAQFTALSRRKVVLLWLVDVAITICDNHNLARVKLAESQSLPGSISENLQEALFADGLKHSELSDPLEFYMYSQRLESVKETDKQLCLCFLLFLKLLLCKSEDERRITQYSQQISDFIITLKNAYESLMKKYPKAHEVGVMYSSFLWEIMRNSAKADAIRIKSLAPVVDSSLDSISFFQSDNGRIIAEVQPGNCGVIVSANKPAHAHLRYDSNVLIGRRVWTVVPVPFRASHSRKTIDFIHSSRDMKLRHPALLYLSTADGFLLECITSLALSAVGKVPLVLLTFKPTVTSKHAAILTNALTIAAHTEGFPYVLSLSFPLLGVHLKDVDLTLYLCYEKYGYWRPFPIKYSFGLFTEETFASQTVAIVHLFEREEDAGFWSSWGRAGWETQVENLANSLPKEFCRSMTKKPSVQFTRNSLRHLTTASSKSKLRASECTAVSAGTSTSSTKRMLVRNSKIIAEMASHFCILKFVTAVAVSPRQMVTLVTGSIVIGSLVYTAVTEVVERDQSRDYVLRQLEIMHLAQTVRHAQVAIVANVNRHRMQHYRDVISLSGEFLSATQKSLSPEAYEDDISQVVTVWKLLDGEVIKQETNLYQAVCDLAESATHIAALADGDMTFQDPAMFYVFRNGLGETYKAVDASVHRYISRKHEVIRAATLQTFAYFLPFSVLLAVTSSLSFYFLYRIQKKVSSVCHLLCSLPPEAYLEARELVTARFKRLHDEGEDLERLIPFATSRKPGCCSTYNCGTLFIGLLFLLSMGWYAMEYFLIVGDISSTLLMWPQAVSLTITRVTNVASMWTWMLEAYLYPQGALSVLRLPGPSDFLNPKETFQRFYEQNKEIRHELLRLELTQQLQVTGNNLQLLYIAANFTCKLMQKGYNPGLRVLQDDFMSNTYSPAWDLWHLNAMYNCTEEVMNQASLVNSIYDAQLEEKLMQRLELLVWFIAVHSVVNLLGMGCGVYWAISRTNGAVRAMWRTLGLFSLKLDSSSATFPDSSLTHSSQP